MRQLRVEAKLRSMGLDLVEFAKAIESDFDVRIPDEEAAKLLTLGEDQFGVAASSISMTAQTRLLDLAPWG